jgi:hypothetical protein
MIEMHRGGYKAIKTGVGSRESGISGKDTATSNCRPERSEGPAVYELNIGALRARFFGAEAPQNDANLLEHFLLTPDY